MIPSVFLLAAPLFLLVLWQRDHSIAEENALMENIQLVSLILTILLTFARSFRDKARDSVFLFLQLFFLTIFLRELDLRPFHLPRSVILLSCEGRDVGLTVGWLVFILSVAGNFKASSKRFVAFMKSDPGLYFILGCLLYGLAWPFDEGMTSLPKIEKRFFEEAMECMGTFSFVLSGLFYYRTAHSRQEKEQYAVRYDLPPR